MATPVLQTVPMVKVLKLRAFLGTRIGMISKVIRYPSRHKRNYVSLEETIREELKRKKKKKKRCDFQFR
jgi:hypothetical protein